MHILTINSGSSSIKATLFRKKDLKEIKRIKMDRIKSYDKAFAEIVEKLEIKDISSVKGVVHRVVHGGEKYFDPTVITRHVEKTIDDLKKLAPLHNPVNLKGIRAAKKIFHCPHFAVFDTAFHQTIPEYAYIYGIPYKYYRADGIRRYGFHGINHKYMYECVLEKTSGKQLNLITCHIGNGVSVTAIRNGKVIDTSMGFTPLEGPIMGTRSGSVDPAIPFFLKRKYGRLKVERLLQKESGLLGLSGISSDMRDILEKVKKNHKKAKKTLATYNYCIARYIAMYHGILGKVDYIVFSGGIGENTEQVRRGILKHVRIAKLPKIMIVKANEAYQMAKEVKSLLFDS